MTQQIYKIGDNIELMRKMPSESVDTIITSPPYWGLRDYGVEGQTGLEDTIEEYHDRLLKVAAECMRLLKPTGIMFWNHGDSYGGSGGSGGDYNEGGLREGQKKVGKSLNTTPKCLTMQNERLIIKMIDEQGWILRNRIIWNKSNGMPSSVSDRFSNKYEPVYMLVKNQRYFFDLDAVRVAYKNPDVGEPYKKNTSHQNTQGKNPGDVWTIPTKPYTGSHFATFPTTLIKPMIKSACPEGGTVLDPFCGSGTVLEVCRKLDRNAIGLELNPDYESLIRKRSMADTPSLASYAD